MSMPLDSEVLEMEKVLQSLKSNQGRSRNLDGVRREVIERFQEIGWIADVSCWKYEDGSVGFDVSLVDRCERPREGTDYERMQWEIRNDILGIEPEKKGLTSTFSPETLHAGVKPPEA